MLYIPRLLQQHIIGMRLGDQLQAQRHFLVVDQGQGHREL
jgi:hypothetical protein